MDIRNKADTNPKENSLSGSQTLGREIDQKEKKGQVSIKQTRIKSQLEREERRFLDLKPCQSALNNPRFHISAYERKNIVDLL